MSRILIVDDDVDLAELVKTRLASDGHEVEDIHTGDGAFQKAKEFQPSIIILDIMLPGSTGYEITRRLRKDPELYRVGILLLTALGEEPEMVHGLEQGADDYLAKPFRLENLMDKLRGLVSLMESIESRNALSGLPGTEAVKREINHRLARGVAISVCYIDMVGFKAYCAATGREGQKQATEFMAKLLRQSARNSGVYEGFMSHLGGEHFVVLLNLEDYERYCSTLIEAFDQGVHQLYKPEDVKKGYILAKDKQGREVKAPLMRLAIGVTHNQHRHYKSAKKVFEVLAQTRQMAKPEGRSVMFVDRRKVDR
jgi:PleD family two-component response regulator